ncbi:hypothetical protein FOPG_01893 [Fusarium oxysporum f. sp. conglutinans race 2 54008]|uniref:Uncharacterized protein n=6 Tax=Fusarium oxysporum TaxID=5507 RepID=A0A2H3SSP8_FUSOX|nr:hypothetical protein FOXB_01133 [Fusarium oxysporum f. sp. conglutinans Fo5176]ENH61123.1 hypothetical protein FOC1_g10015929 [Fusarium oxysporum f. sp. cubense race 1]EXL87015.1 hypothetical protein FOPG_01893 [Fusarium oxysporum f. sp. conglutinans race 2 54008]EXM27744.1 hypothetical protein FOTG_06100 [Fusarium oxysporum f. sp. vasinfectum 25433]KAF6529707.1 hypothetical protein HZS61_001019 [Fusarium oxysporum f. sp. conglutinans]KAI8418484.1 hypothetical protein FOFC_01052 [Fusarium o
MDAPNNTSQSQDPQVDVPKENSPPPAYTPRRVPVTDFTAMMARIIQERRDALPNMGGNNPRPQPQQTTCTSLLSDTVDDDQDETSEGSSPISLKIDTSVNVSRNNNIVCLTATPAEQANAIAKAVVQALHEGSSGRCGIPMIDESGCPRPLSIQVDAGLNVEGTGNVIGSRDVIGGLIQKRAGSSLRLDLDDEEDLAPTKRRRTSH